MSYTLWPESLPPLPLRDDFAASGSQPVRRQQMESGADRITRISSTTVRTNSVSFICDSEQAAEFWSFYEADANAGADWVLIPMMTGNKVLPHKCRIASYPEQAPDGLEWRMSFSLETDEQHIDWG